MRECKNAGMRENRRLYMGLMGWWIVLFLFNLLLSSCSQKQYEVKKYHITGQVTNRPEGTIVLEKLDLVTNERAFVSKTEIKEGRFEFKDTISGWGLHSFVIDDSVRIPFFIEPGKIEVIIPDCQKAEAEIKGGINNDLLKEHKFTFDKNKAIPIIQNNPTTTFAAFTTFYVLMNNNLSPDTITQLVNLLEGEALESVYIPHISKIAKAVERTAIGKIAPDFTVNDSTGTAINLSDFKGKYVLLDFWTSWCKPCREANPGWKKHYEKYKSDQLEFLGVSFDVSCTPWKKALIKDQLLWPNGCNCKGWDEISDLYGVKSVPQTFFIGPDGRILEKNIKPEDFERVVKVLSRH